MANYYRLIMVFVITLQSIFSFAQKQTYDLVSYTPPAGWNKEMQQNGLQLYVRDAGTGAYAIAIILKAMPSTAPVGENFNNNWEKLIKGSVNVAGVPAMEQPSKDKGWDIVSGSAGYTDGADKGLVTLISATGDGQTVSVILMTNTQQYQNDLLTFVRSLKLSAVTKNVTNRTPPQKAENPTAGNTGISGAWSQSSSGSSYGQSLSNGYTTMQYTFNSNGTYQYVAKTFSQNVSYLILSKENGKYTIAGNKLTIIPVDGITQSWTKKAGTTGTGDDWGKLQRSEKRSLEKSVYTFTLYYFEGIKETNLVLQTDKETLRDGRHSTNTLFANAWYYKPISGSNPRIELP
ncbi:MAG: hypothetical protein QM731_26110 [Chitinophagaceae bacterium]